MIHRFADCVLDTERVVLTRGGAEVHVEPQVFDLIAAVVAAQGRLVGYEDLVAQVWQGRIVSDATIAARISAARKALGDDGRAQRVLLTVPRRGVRLRVPVTGAAVPSAPSVPLVSEGAPQIDPPRQTLRYTAGRDGAALAWAESGTGPALLRGGHWLSHLEHDWQSPVWRPLLARLSAGRRLVRYDPRGTGLSDRTRGAASTEQLAGDMMAVADAAGLDRFPVFAASQSAPVALLAAAMWPERIDRIAIWGGFATGSTRRGGAAKTEAMVEMIRRGWGRSGSAFMKAFATLYMPDATPGEVDSLMRMQALSVEAETAAALRRMIGKIDVRDVLARVTAPVLVLHASGDAIQPVEQGQVLARHLPNAQFHLVESANHVLVPSDPAWDGILRRIEAFLDRPD
jgi:pimeloyl-ACP methyl ester carboxylesterase/DNA-binding winged helix-turn-helix (wHTH) protein